MRSGGFRDACRGGSAACPRERVSSRDVQPTGESGSRSPQAPRRVSAALVSADTGPEATACGSCSISSIAGTANRS